MFDCAATISCGSDTVTDPTGQIIRFICCNISKSSLNSIHENYGHLMLSKDPGKMIKGQNITLVEIFVVLAGLEVFR